MTIITFPSFEPDKADLDTNVVDSSVGVLPGAGVLLPIPEPTVYSTALVSTGADTRCLGGISARNSSDAIETYAGTNNSLAQLGADLDWDNRSKAGGYSVTTDYYWQFCQFGSQYLIAVTDNNAPQVLDIDSGTNFADLSGSPPTSRYCAIVNQFLVLAGQTAAPSKLQWSAIGDHTGWTVGTNQSDEQEFPSGGKIQNITGGRTFGTIYQEHVIRRMSYVAGDIIFRMDELVDDVGLIAPYSVVSVFGSDYFYSSKGWARLNPDGSLDPIGALKVDAWFKDNADPDKLNQIVGVSDPARKLIWWLYHSRNSATNYQDASLVYSWETNEFRPSSIGGSFLLSLETPGYTLEQLEDVLGYTNLDTILVSLDSREFNGGVPVLGTFGTDDKLYFVNGANRAVEVETGLFQLNPAGRAFVQGISPVIEVPDGQGTPSPTIALGYRNVPWESVTFTSTAGTAVDSVAGEAHFEQSGRDFKARLKIAAGENWNKIHGIRQPRYRPDGWM